MTDNTQDPTVEDRIDIDLSKIDQPNLFIENVEQNYTLTLNDIKLTKSREAQRPMLDCTWVVQHPESGEEVRIRDFPLLDQQRGKFRLRQIIVAKGLDSTGVPNPISLLVGAQAPAELEVDDSPEFGKQNRIKRLLVDVPKNVR